MRSSNWSCQDTELLFRWRSETQKQGQPGKSAWEQMAEHIPGKGAHQCRLRHLQLAMIARLPHQKNSRPVGYRQQLPQFHPQVISSRRTWERRVIHWLLKTFSWLRVHGFQW